MNFNDITVNFFHIRREILLSEWTWFIGNKVPILVTAMGDVFVQDPDDFSVHFLSVIYGQIEKVASSTEEFKVCLNDREFLGKYFHVQMIGELIRLGKKLKEKSIYSLIHPLWLSGEFDLNNIEITDIHVHFSIAGQTFQQVVNLPNGTKISGFSFKFEKKSRSWWKFWS